MLTSMSWIKTITINIVLILALLGLLFIAPPIIFIGYKMATAEAEYDSRAALPNYKNISWAEKHFEENHNLTVTYYDFIVWRVDDFDGETISIKNGLRRTIQTEGMLKQSQTGSQVWFFGGSTTFGSGVKDKYTYPSIFAQKTGYHVSNFGAKAYLARQSLALLNNTYIANPREEEQSGKRSVVFYDGVNDVADRCRSEVQGLATGRQVRIQERVKYARLSFLATFSEVIFFLQKVVAWTGGGPTTNQSGYDCDLNPKKSEFIASSLVKTWEQASFLAKANGDEFIAILQPVAFIGNPSLSHLNLSDIDSVALKKQYAAVYPIIRQIASSAPINFVDLTDAYDECDYCYIDWSHVSPNAHEILVDLMINKLDV